MFCTVNIKPKEWTKQTSRLGYKQIEVLPTGTGYRIFKLEFGWTGTGYRILKFEFCWTGTEYRILEFKFCWTGTGYRISKFKFGQAETEFQQNNSAEYCNLNWIAAKKNI